MYIYLLVTQQNIYLSSKEVMHIYIFRELLLKNYKFYSSHSSFFLKNYTNKTKIITGFNKKMINAGKIN